jgi:hypothetical protein
MLEFVRLLTRCHKVDFPEGAYVMPGLMKDKFSKIEEIIKKPIFSSSALRAGDIIYVNRGLYKHYGVYAGNGKVFHFAPYSGTEISAENAVVHETTLEAFLKGGKLEIDKKTKAKFPRQEIVSRARSKIGGKGYSLPFNNCEHFARWCTTGVYESKQVIDAAGIVIEGIDLAIDAISGKPDSIKAEKVIKKLKDYLH